MQSFSPKTNILPVSESESIPSRRDTYSVDTGPIVFEQNSTPTPRRSILKCSKTTKPNRSRSGNRMVQFARLPKSDSRIKMSRSRFNTVPSVSTTDEFYGNEISQDSKNTTMFNVEEEYDDDLDGVQPLDISVSSLINSPILDTASIHKSSKRGSRGNKVMSLINSFENRTGSPKHSIRASDLLSLNGTVSEDTTLNESQRNSSSLHDSVSSTRRINLEDVFVAEDSLKNASCSIENKTAVHEIDESSEQHTEIISDSEINVLNNTDTINVSDKVSDLSSDVSISENEFNFASPLKILPQIDSIKTTVTDHNQSTIINTEKDNLTEVINNQCKTNISELNLSCDIEENCKQLVNKSLTVSNNSVENSSLALNNTCDHDNITHIQNNSSTNINSSLHESSDTIINSSHVSALLEINKFEDENKGPKINSELSENSVNIEKDHTDVQNSVTDFSENLINVEQDHSNAPSNDVSILVRQSNVENDDLGMQKNVSKIIDEESPSMIVQSISKMLNSSVDELEITHSQHKENLNESYVLVDKHSPQNISSGKTEVSTENLNKSFMDAIEVQLDKMHDSNVSFKENELVSINSSQDTNIEKTLTSSIISEKIEIENPNLEVNDDSSINSMSVLLVNESTSNITNPASKITLSTKHNSSNRNSDISQLTDNDSDKNISNKNNSNSKIIKVDDESINSSKTVPSDNFDNEKEKSKLVNNSHQETSNISNRTHSFRNLNNSKKNLSINVIENKKTCSSQKIVDKDSTHSDVDQMEDSGKINKSYEAPLDTSIGKPQYESTPWNGSKSSKTLHSTASNQANETSHIDVSIIADKQNTTLSNSSTSLQLDESVHDNITEKVNDQRNRSRSITPDIKPDIWSQMMKDFNESVKKASVANYNNSVKIPINRSLQPDDLFIIVKTEEVSSNCTDSENITQLEAENKSALHSSNNTLNTSIEHQDEQSSRNNTRSEFQTESPERSSKTKSVQSKQLKMEVLKNSEEIINNVVSSNKKNSINTETTITNKKRSNTIVLNDSSSDISKKNSEGTKKSLPCDVANCVKKNKKTTSTKPNIAISTSQSEHDSDTDISSNKSLRITRNKKMTKKKHSSPELQPKKRNLRGQVEKNESGNSNKKLDKVNVTITDATSSGNDTETCSSESANVFPTTKRQLRKREQNLCNEQLKPTLKDKKKLISSNKPLRNTSNSDKNSGKILIPEKSKEIQPIKTRLTRSNTVLNEASLPKLNKKTVSSSPIKAKSVKVGKIKKTINSKSNKKSQSKSLPSKPITKKDKSDSSEYESLSETEEIPQKTQSVNNQPKTKKENIKKKNVQINNSPLLSTKRNRREIIETLKVSPQLSTRSRKRAADTSPLCQPNTKGLKRDISSKIANTTNSHVSNSPKEYASSSTIKLTRNKSKLVSQNSNNSFPESVKTGKKENITTKSLPKKRVLNSDESSIDCAPSARKMTRKATAKENETKVKKPNASTRSKSKVPSIDTDDSENSAK